MTLILWSWIVTVRDPVASVCDQLVRAPADLDGALGERRERAADVKRAALDRGGELRVELRGR